MKIQQKIWFVLIILILLMSFAFPAVPVIAADTNNGNGNGGGGGNGGGNGNGQYTGPTMLKDFGRDVMKNPITNAEKKEAANAQYLLRLQTAQLQKDKGKTVSAALTPTPGGVPDIFGPYPNYAYSQQPQIDASGNVIAGTGVRKFVDGLPGLGAANANNLGQYIPVAVPDTITYPGTDYYEIAAVQYSEKMHSDVPAAQNLRGYVQLNYGTDALGANTIAPAPVHYLGPLIQANQGRPVRVKFTNLVTTTTDPLHLFLPLDVTMMGAGVGPDGVTNLPDSRVTMPHLHGGDTEWNSDGTPDEWVAPILQTGLPAGQGWAKGYSTTDVSDMPVSPGGSVTLFWTNGISARLMFFHDHTQGYTAVSVYAGIAAPYILRDKTETDLINGTNVSGNNPTLAKALPDSAHEIPLVIQDKTFVPTTTGTWTTMNGTFTGGEIGAFDPTWDTTKWGGQGSLWFPHVYMSMENPYNTPNGVTAMGRWDYGPWVGAPIIWLNGPIANPYYDPVNAPWEPPLTIGTPNVSITGEAFMDTMVVNGTAYPTLTVQPTGYRFRILSVGVDRTLNLSLWQAAPLTASVTKMGSGYTSPPSVAINGGSVSGATATTKLGVASITVNNIGAGYSANSPPAVTISGASGTGAQAGAVVSAAGTIASIAVLVPGDGFTGVATVTIAPPILSGGVQATATAVMGLGSITFSGGTASSGPIVNPTLSFSGGGGSGAAGIASVLSDPVMVPAVVDPSIPFPTSWTVSTGPSVRPNILDARPGGVPDPRTMGPSWLVIGNEGGFLAQASTIDPSPVGFDHNTGDMIYDNVINSSLLLFPAERADVIVDFSQYAGKTLILYNDAPAPFPRPYFPNDMYTNDPDMTVGGGTQTTLAGYGSNTRTVMQIRVAAATPVPFNTAPIIAALPAVFKATQPPPIVPNPIFNAAYGANYPTDYVRPLDVMFSPATGGTTVNNVVVTGRGTLYYTGTPTVALTGGGPNGGAPTTIATATAALLDQGGIDTIIPLYEGAGYVTPPTVTVAPPPAGGTQATAQAFVTAGQVFRIDVINPGSGYIQVPTVTVSPPPPGGAPCIASATLGTVFPMVGTGTGYNAATTRVTITGGGGTGAAATPYLGIGSVTLSTTGNYPVQDVNHPVMITVTGGGGTGAVLLPVMAVNPIPGTLGLGYTVAGITIANPGSGYTSLPTITFSQAGTPIAGTVQATAVVASLGVSRIWATNLGTGYTTAPTVTITDTAVAPLVPGTGASYIAVPPIAGKLTTGRLGAITIPAGGGGAGYTTAPQVTIFGGGTGSTATAYATLTGTPTYWVVPHTLTGTFERYYGRLTQYFGTNLALTNYYVDPPYDYYADSVTIGPPVAGDSTQVWRIAEAPGTVDSHIIHFHLVNVQVVCRITADGNIHPPEPTEAGWCESVEINPNEDLVVALRPVGPKLPFGVPDNIRPLSPSEPIGATGSFSGLTSAGTGITVSNQLFNFHWEYVYHCHMLSHEDNDLMRPVVFMPAVAVPAAPTGLTVTATTTVPNTLTWTDPTSFNYTTDWATPAKLGVPASEVGFRIYRGTGLNPVTLLATVPANYTSYIDGTAAAGTTYRYQVAAFNAVGETRSTAVSVTARLALAVPAVPTLVAPASGAAVSSGGNIPFSWNAVTGATSYTLQVFSGATMVVNMPGLIHTSITVPSNGVLRAGAYTWKVSATNTRGSSAFSAALPFTVVVPAAPPVPVLTAPATGAVNVSGYASISLTWGAATGATSYGLQVTPSGSPTPVINAANITATTYAIPANTLKPGTTYSWQVNATNAGGTSAYSTAFTFRTSRFSISDFDGDLKADEGLYVGGSWYIQQTSTNTVVSNWFGGWPGAILVNADYDGDGKADEALYLNGGWYILQSSNSAIASHWFGGWPGSVPVVGDFDGDGKGDLGLYVGGSWYITQSSTNTVVSSYFAGWSGAVPVPADYDGDGKTDMAVYVNGSWYVLESSTNTVVSFWFGGWAGGVPVPADYDGDGKADAAIYMNGGWYILQSSTNTIVSNWFGGWAGSTVIP